MTRPISPAPISNPRSRPRAATAMEPANPPSPISARRPSQVMGPPPPIASEHGSVRTATGPLRHPKPYTPSDIHSMLEQEQEAMVNRLSRELSQLRHQTTSVASTASSTSTTLNDPTDPHHLTGAAHPTASRRHRSSSSLSSSYIPTVQGIRSGSVSGIAPLRDTGVPSQRPGGGGGGGGGGDSSRPGRSREPSLTSRSSEYSLHQPPPPMPVPIPVPQQSDALTSSHHTTASGGGGPHPSSHRSSLSRQRSPASSISRHEEIVQHRGEWEALKKENEALRQRVRELENRVKKLREGETRTGTGTGTGTTATEEKGQDANANAN